MNERHFLASLALLLTLLLGACGAKVEESPPLAGASIGGPFTLTDQDGKQVSDKDFDGRYRLVYFGFTYCPDVCPVDLQVIGQGLRQLEKSDPAVAAKVQPIFISVDPARDTPAVLKPYVAAFHPRLIGLTGTPEQIARVAKDFVVLYNVDGKPGDKDYLVSHSRTPYLFDPDGKPVALVPVDDPGTPNVDEGAPDKVLAALRKWVK